MNDSIPLMTRYLLGELSEQEQTAFEARYFEDPRVFDELAEVESALVDDYVRGRLPPATRQRFEAHFMADPRRRDRVRFAEALTARIDRGETEPRAEAATASPWQSWLDWIRTPRFAMAFATALALVVIGTWLVVNSRRASEEIATGPEPQEDRRTGDLAPAPPAAGEVPPTPVPPTGTTPQPSPPPRLLLAVATLALTVGPGERSAESKEPPTLTLSPGTEQVRFALGLREHEYPRYRVLVRLIGGAEVMREGDLVPPSGAPAPALTLTAPAARFADGDYLLTLQGMTADGEYEDLSQTIFRVARP